MLHRTIIVPKAKQALLLALLIALSGCGTVREQAHQATALDAATTAAGVLGGSAIEANPLIGSPAAFAGLMLARVVGVEIANQMPEPQRTDVLTGWSSIWWGAGVSNLVVLLAASNPVGLAAGAMFAAGWWQSTAMEREFAAICARERLSQPALRCTFTAPG